MSRSALYGNLPISPTVKPIVQQVSGGIYHRGNNNIKLEIKLLEEAMNTSVNEMVI